MKNPNKLRGGDLITVQCRARNVAESALVAFWMEGRDESCFLHHRAWLMENLHKLAAACGFDLVERKPAADEAEAAL